MSEFNIAAKSKDEQDKVNVDLAASGVAYKERLNMPVIAEQVARVLHGASAILPRAEHHLAESIRPALSGNV